MKFDVIIGNPPYQLSTGSGSAQATPLYNKFVLQAKKLNPRFLAMIIPGRWYAGGMGLDDFRTSMLSDRRMRKLVDFPNAKDCFPGVEIRGGVCYFLWDRDNPGNCEYTNISNNISDTKIRVLDEYPVFLRWNQSVGIIKKIKNLKEDTLVEMISSVSPFGLSTSTRGSKVRVQNGATLHSSKGISYIDRLDIKTGSKYLDKYKVLLSRPISGNMEVPPFKILSLLKTLSPGEVCTHTYLLAGPFDDKERADNLKSYLGTRFARFLLSQSISGMDISRDKFRFVPTQDFNEKWTDEKLYAKYNLSEEEIKFIESMIKPMELDK